MEQLKTAFSILSKGIIISQNSQKYHDIANFLNIDDNFDMLYKLLHQLGFELVGENGYFYLAKEERLTAEESEYFVSKHKKTIVAISILKQIIPLTAPNDILKQSEFMVEFLKRKDDLLLKKIDYLFGETDTKTMIEEFFKLLDKAFVIERIDTKDKDSYKVMHSINYYVKIVESIG